MDNSVNSPRRILCSAKLYKTILETVDPGWVVLRRNGGGGGGGGVKGDGSC